MRWHMHHGLSQDLLGFIPQFLYEFDPRPAAEQFNEAYAHGGGWSSFGKGKWKLRLKSEEAVPADEQDRMYEGSTLVYPGDPAFKLIAHANLHLGSGKPEVIFVFEGGPWVVIKQLNSDEFDVARMD